MTYTEQVKKQEEKREDMLYRFLIYRALEAMTAIVELKAGDGKRAEKIVEEYIATH